MAPQQQAGGTASAAAAPSDLMRAAALNAPGGPEALQPCLWPRPGRGRGKVLVRVAAAGLNPIDGKVRAGRAFPFTPLLRLPKVPGGDLAGVVEAAPPASRFKRGDRVFAVTDGFFPQKDLGTYAEWAEVEEGHLAPLPPRLSFAEGAGVPLVALTAWQGLDALPLPPGARILVHGGSGGVGAMAVQLAARVKRWHVTATCSPANAAYCRELGAAVTHDWREAGLLLKRYRHQPFDCVFDVVGGSTMRDSLALLRPGGHLVEVWTNAEKWVKQAGGELAGKLACLADFAGSKLRGALGLGPRLHTVLIRPDGRQLGRVAELLQAGTLAPPRVARTFPLEAASEAHAFFESKDRPAGKVVLTMVADD